MEKEIDKLKNKIVNADCFDILRQLPDKCIDLILTDPPYLYTNCDFDQKKFDEELFFKECYRVLKDNKIICFTGYSDSFFRWNMLCASIGFKFKENPVFDKVAVSSPFRVIPLRHEQISIREKGKATLNKIRKKYVEELMEIAAYEQLIRTCKRVDTLIRRKPKDAEEYLRTHTLNFEYNRNKKFNVSCPAKFLDADQGIKSLRNLEEGGVQNSIFSIKCNRNNNIHPTQKPVELFERLIKICSNTGDIVLDPFSGSGTTAIACHNLHRIFICVEKDKNYWQKSLERLESEPKDLFYH